MENSVNLKPCTAYCLQIDVELGGVLHNMTRVRQMLEEIGQQGPGLVVLPELWLSSFDYERLHEHAVHTPNILAQLQSMAREYNVYLAGSLPEVEGDSNTRKIHNTMFITGPEGVVGKYRKQQLFAPINENNHFAAGDEPQPIDTTLGRLSSLVCYDLRFPELARSQAAKGAKLMVVSAQWPAERRVQWRYLLIARAIENQMYVVACNRCGKDGETGFAGHSMIIAPDGKVLAEGKSKEEVVSAKIEPQKIYEVRENFRTIGSVPYSFHDENKFVSLEELRAKIAHFKRVGRKIVFTNGCFDILHQGHVTYLEKARRMGDCLVIGLNNDASVKAIKGSSRPMNVEDSRARVLVALGCVDFVVLFGDKTPLELIKAVMPDILVKGGDWPVDKIVGAREVMANGGWALNIPLVDNFSTTGMIYAIKKSGEDSK